MTRIETQIPPQRLVDALRQFAKLEHIHLLYLTADVKNLSTPGASGYLTADETLSRLLDGTGLKYRYVGGETVSIIHARDAVGSPQNKSGSEKPLHQPRQIHDPETPPSDSPMDPEKAPVPPRRALTKTNLTAALLHEVIVTAQKYRQSAFDVPISLNVISGTELLAYGITDLSSLQYDVPGLYMNSSGYSQSVYIRGVANDSGNGAVVGQYIDEADITAEGTAGQAGLATGDAGLYDLNRVEVLKGPQGTLYGDGSLGGVIRYITNRPVLNTFEMSADVAEMLTEHGSPSQRIEMMLNTPVIEGLLGLRVASILEHDGGWVD
ncbi:MAG TPA: TonB-dependent receptor plug domain-containing protein, partial [Steroidobacteraceae bacterium]|nr:TonB-dependent receptor plug domain-containing protein [Steroidobacteraceae bacterium]